MDNQVPGSNFTIVTPPEPPKSKKKISVRTIIGIVSLIVITGGLITASIIFLKPIRRKVPAKLFKDIDINWKQHTNDRGSEATTEISLTNNTDDPIYNITIEKYKFWCPNYYLLCQPGQCADGQPILRCPDPEHGITGEGSQENEVITRINAGQTLTRSITQQVGGNGQCGSAQVDFKIKVQNDYSPDVLWGVAFQDQPCIPPTVTPTPTTPPGDPTNTPVPTNTPTVTPTPPNIPSVTPSVTPSSTPTPIPKACHQACSYTSQCQTGLECRADWCPEGQNCNPVLECTNPACPKTTAADCSCPAEPTYTPTPTPSNMPTPTEIYLAATSTPTTVPPVARATEVPAAGLPGFLKAFSAVSLAILLIGLLF